MCKKFLGQGSKESAENRQIGMCNGEEEGEGLGGKHLKRAARFQEGLAMPVESARAKAAPWRKPVSCLVAKEAWSRGQGMACPEGPTAGDVSWQCSLNQAGGQSGSHRAVPRATVL